MDELLKHNRFVNRNPWIIMVDFNVSLKLEDSTSSISVLSASMKEFKECITELNMEDINSSSFHFTWHQR